MLRPHTRIVARGEIEDIDFSNVEDGFLAAEAEEDEMRRRGGDDEDGDDGDERQLARAMPAEGAFGDPDVARPLKVAVGGAARERSAASMSTFFSSSTKTTAQYAYRDKRLWPFSAHEFGRLFRLRKMNAADENRYVTEVDVRGGCADRAARAVPGSLRLTLPRPPSLLSPHR